MFGISVTKLSRQDSQQQQLLFMKSYIVSLSRYADMVQWFCTNCIVFCHERKMFADTRWQVYREADKYGLGKFSESPLTTSAVKSGGFKAMADSRHLWQSC